MHRFPIRVAETSLEMSDGSENASSPSGFCPDPLWDASRTWLTDDPDFTRCFHETVLVYVPAVILLVLGPYQYAVARSSKDSLVPWSVTLIAKVAINALLILLPVIDLVYEIVVKPNGVFYVSALVRIISSSSALGLLLYSKRRGIPAPDALFYFWMTDAICLAITFRSVIRFESVGDFLPYVTETMSFVLAAAMLILNCFAEHRPKYINIDDQVENVTPEKFASTPSRIIFSWMDSLALKGWRTKLEPDSLWSLQLQNRCDGVIPRWDAAWSASADRASIAKAHSQDLATKTRRRKKKAREGKISILPVLARSFGKAYFASSVLMFVLSFLYFASPQLVNLLITFVTSGEPLWRGYLYTVLIFASTSVVTILNSQAFYREYLVGLRVRTALISAIYRKSLRLSNTARKQMTVGETTNLMQIDSQKFMDLCLYLNLVWSCPLQIGLALYFLWEILGPSSLAGLAVMILLIPLNAWIASKMRRLQLRQMSSKDRRTKLMDEILNGVKILKLYAWETSFREQVLTIRRAEIASLRGLAYYSAGMTFLWTCAPVVIALASFATFVLSSPLNVLDANTAFVSLTLFNILRIPMNLLPILLVYLVQCNVSLKRINKFMNSPELDPYAVSHNRDVGDVIHVSAADFAWEKPPQEYFKRQLIQPSLDSDLIKRQHSFNAWRPTLRGINLNVRPGALVAVVGPVGAGKSSLLSALLGEMERPAGTANVRGAVAYVPQQAWIQNGTVRYNVAFGSAFSEERYQQVLDACALKPDLAMLPGGDQTEIGEKGINLSGGQKQRISMARAVYSDGDLYLLDDPLSAVDAHVGAHMFKEVIGKDGILRDKTRVLVTHSAKYLPQCDNIVVMKDGHISEQGDYKTLLQSGGDFAEFLITYLTEEEEKMGEGDEASEGTASETASNLEGLRHELEEVMGKDRFQRQMSMAKSQRSSHHSKGSAQMADDRPSKERRSSHRPRSRKMTEQTTGGFAYDVVRRDSSSSSAASAVTRKGGGAGNDAAKAGQTLIEEETAQEGGVKWTVYWYYATCIGLVMGGVSLVLYVGYQAFSVGSSIWLAAWSTDPKATTDIPTRNKYLAVYGVLGLLQAAFIMAATVMISVACLNAATKLHATMLTRILRSPMSFFDTTPLGRILNRFSKDIDIIDVTIPLYLRGVITQSLIVLGTIFIVCYTNPWFILIIVPILIIFYFLQKFYVATARQVKRLESITRSPIYSHFGETISGAPTIRAYGVAHRFVKENEKKIDINQICYYPTFVASRWLAVRLETIGNLIVFFAALFAVLTRDTMDPGLVGLSLSYSLTITQAMSYLISQTSEIETNMVGVERIKEYQEVREEAPLFMPGQDPPEDWPQHGVVEFKNYQTRYREGLDLVLKGIDCLIRSGEKVGIVGRTGAGKSSLTLALFRIIESAGGAIVIDGQDVALMGLHRLRSRLTIIPQDPVLFSGSLRMNLDPFDHHSDREVWTALEQAHLGQYVRNLPGELFFEVNEGGENLSVGQRQLVCLARALLRKTKVLILDEATAAIDLETDDLIQETIRSAFAECTVLTIAHRLNTIMDSSKVMVLDAGRVIEFDSPEALLQREDSVFAGMAREAGLVKANDPQEAEDLMGHDDLTIDTIPEDGKGTEDIKSVMDSRRLPRQESSSSSIGSFKGSK